MNPTFKCHLVIPQGTLSGPKPQSEIAFKRAGACRIGWQFFLAAAVGALLCTSRVSGDTFVNTGTLGTERAFHTITVLANGKVLVVAGIATGGAYLSTAELYDPCTRTWSTTGSLHVQRRGHTATLLLDGRVLVAGGNDSSGAVSLAETYDPNTGLWTTTDLLFAPRMNHS